MVGLSREREAVLGSGQATKHGGFSIWQQTGSLLSVVVTEREFGTLLRVNTMRR